MKSLTQAQSELLHFLKAYIAETGGIAPSYDEMREQVGLSSKSGVHRLIKALEERGHIRRRPNRARCIEIVEQGALDGFSTLELMAELARRNRRNPQDETLWKRPVSIKKNAAQEGVGSTLSGPDLNACKGGC